MVQACQLSRRFGSQRPAIDRLKALFEGDFLHAIPEKTTNIVFKPLCGSHSILGEGLWACVEVFVIMWPAA
jgi:hypothetical protein